MTPLRGKSFGQPVFIEYTFEPRAANGWFEPFVKNVIMSIHGVPLLINTEDLKLQELLESKNDTNYLED
jgi:hypothetical protein